MSTISTKLESDTLHKADVKDPRPALTPEEAHEAALVLLATLQALWETATPEWRARYTEPDNAKRRRQQPSSERNIG